jgi:uncharacterized protein RhaS with RHS repeats
MPLRYAYDEEGNIVKRTDPDGNERQLIYDYRNRLTEVKDYTGTIAGGTLRQHVKYEYDTFNRRIARWADTNGNGASDREEFYVYDGDDVVLDFVDANGATGGVSPVLNAVPARPGRGSDPRARGAANRSRNA